MRAQVRSLVHAAQKACKGTKNFSYTQEENAFLCKKSTKVPKYFAYINFFLYFCRRIMDQIDIKEKNAMYRRWLYMVLAIITSVVLLHRPVFSFNEDKGIIYVRSFSMTQKTFIVTQTALANGAAEVTAIMSVKGLYYCAWALIISCVACLLSIFSDRRRMGWCVLAVFIAGAYYILMIYYAMRMSGDHYATLYPNFYALLPALVMQFMLLVRRSLAKTLMANNDNEEMEE
jgi:hypothetical protein